MLLFGKELFFIFLSRLFGFETPLLMLFLVALPVGIIDSHSPCLSVIAVRCVSVNRHLVFTSVMIIVITF